MRRRGVWFSCLLLILAATAAWARQGEKKMRGPPAAQGERTSQGAAGAPTAEPKAIVYVYRPHRMTAWSNEPSVYADGRELARIQNGRFFIVSLDPGPHTLRSNDKASGVEIVLKPGQKYYLRVDMVQSFWNFHGRVTLVAPEQGEYEVKQTKPLDESHIGDKERVAVGPIAPEPEK